MESVTNRFLMFYAELLRQKKVDNDSDFTKKVGIGSSSLTEFQKGRTGVGIKVLQKTVTAFPELNMNWILTGDGEMTKNAGNTPPANDENHSSTAIKSDKTQHAEGYFESQNASPTASPTLKKRSKTYDITPANISVVGENIIKYNIGAPTVITVNDQGHENVTYVPVKARAGYLLGYGDPEYITQLPSYRLPGLNNGSYRMFEVDGPSMAPGITSGDRVVGQWVSDLAEIRDNRVYIIVSRDKGIVVKRLLNRLKERGKLYLKSDTITHRHDYPTIELDPSEIIEVWYCRLKLSGDFSEPSEVYHRISDLEAEMVESRSQITQILARLNSPKP